MDEQSVATFPTRVQRHNMQWSTGLDRIAGTQGTRDFKANCTFEEEASIHLSHNWKSPTRGNARSRGCHFTPFIKRVGPSWWCSPARSKKVFRRPGHHRRWWPGPLKNFADRVSTPTGVPERYGKFQENYDIFWWKLSETFRGNFHLQH